MFSMVVVGYTWLFKFNIIKIILKKNLVFRLYRLFLSGYW